MSMNEVAAGSDTLMTGGYDVGCELVALWVGEQVGVYFSPSVEALVVQHGSRVVSADEARQAFETIDYTHEDTGVRTVLIDMRAAPRSCQCDFCELRSPRGGYGILAAVVAESGENLLTGVSQFASFDVAIECVRPRKRHAPNVPCPLGFERVVDLVEKKGGRMVFSNYVGTVFELPKHNAVYLQWSGNTSEDVNLDTCLLALGNAVRRLKASKVICDHRHRPILKSRVNELLASFINDERMVKQMISVGSWPRGVAPLAEALQSAPVFDCVERLNQAIATLEQAHKERTRRLAA